MDDPIRCCWCLSSDLYKEYHDQEWGTPVYDDATLFEFLILETFQAGLSWITILNKGRISGKRLTISTIKKSPLFRRQDPSPFWTQESFVTN
jgi:DNA-3-methyladenine glycosylase I